VRERALIYVGGSKGAGQTTFVEAILADTGTRQLLIVYLRETRPLQIVTIWDARRGAPSLA